MLVREPSFVALTSLFLVAAGAAYPAHAQARSDEPASPIAGQPSPGRDAHPGPAPGRMFVVGRVLDPKGEPVPGAMVAVQARSLMPGRPPYLPNSQYIQIGGARADGSGRFRIDAPRMS
jgi:protocatechuate 3,4-dioxygenase beta subunit